MREVVIIIIFCIKVNISFNFPHNAIFFSRSDADLGLNKDVTELLNECEQPGLVQTLLLPEDLALRHLPALSVAHRRLDFTNQRPPLTPLDEVTSHLPLYLELFLQFVCRQLHSSYIQIIFHLGYKFFLVFI